MTCTSHVLQNALYSNVLFVQNVKYSKNNDFEHFIVITYGDSSKTII